MRIPISINGAVLNGKHTYRDYHMIIGNTDVVGPPIPYTQYIDVPYGKPVDLTEFYGEVTYTNRELRIEVGALKDIKKWGSFMTRMYQDIQGQRVTVILDCEPDWYYIGRASVEDFTRSQELGRFTIYVEADPYKYSILESTDEWVWDTFSFIDGAILSYKDIEVEGVREVRVINSDKRVVPEITVSSDMAADFEGKRYDLLSGTNKDYGIRLHSGENTIRFIGNGTVTIRYRRGSL